MPVNTIKAGVYQWTLVTSSQTVTGHIVVRGPSAGPIGQYNYAQSTETWYRGSTSSGGTPGFDFELVLMRSPTDTSLLNAVSWIRSNETVIGTADMVPVWTQDPPLASNVQVYTMTSVTNGIGSFGSLYEHVSFAMPDPTKMPAFYTDYSTLYSIFGGSSLGVPVQEGTKAHFSPIGSSDDGYPDSSWYWYGRDLS